MGDREEGQEQEQQQQHYPTNDYEQSTLSDFLS
jgi:hypothetical protein